MTSLRLPHQKPAVIYKYTRSEFRDAFFASGSLMLGTVYGYRDIEKFGTAVGDEREGTRAIARRDVDGVEVAPDEPLLDEVFPTGSIVSNIDFVRTDHCENALTFCGGFEFRESDMRRWNAEYGYDACYVVHDVDAFARAVLAQRTDVTRGRYVIARCAYVGDEVSYLSSEARMWPGFVKKNEHAWQKERRIVWPVTEPTKLSHPDRPILVPEAVPFCRPWARLARGRVVYDK